MSKASVFLNEVKKDVERTNYKLYYEVQDKLDKLADKVNSKYREHSWFRKHSFYLTDVNADDENVMDAAKEGGFRREGEKYSELLLGSAFSAAVSRAEDLPDTIRSKVMTQINKIEADFYNQYRGMIKKNIDLENSWEKEE